MSGWGLSNPFMHQPLFQSVSANWAPLEAVWASQVTIVVKNPPAEAGDVRDAGSILGLGRFPGEANRCPLQYSCLRNPMDRGTWQATVHGVAKSRTQLSN